MAEKKTVYTLQLDADTQKIISKVNGLKSNLAGLFESGNAPKGLTKSFDQIVDLVGKIQDKTSKPLVSVSEFTSVSKDITKLQVAFGGLTRQINMLEDLSEEAKISLLPPNEQARISQAITALKDYNKNLAEVAKNRALLEKAQKQQLSKKREKDTADNKVSNKKAEISRKVDKRAEKQKVLEGIDDKTSEKAQKLNQEINNLNEEIKLLNESLVTLQKTQQQAKTAFEQSSNVVDNFSKATDKLEKESLRSLREEAKKLGISLDKVDGETPAEELDRLADAIKEVGSSGLSQIPEQLKKYTKASNEGSNATKKMAETVDLATTEYKELAEVVSKQQDFENRIKAFLGIQGAAHVMRSALRDAMTTISELDTTMAEMSVVTDLGVSDYWDQLPQYTKRANELGLAINDVYKADTLFYQQGLKTNEVVAISTETMKMARISGLDTAEATDRMTAALRGFNMELNETSAKKVADVYSELAAITAADTEEISAAMTKTASIASSAGMEFETTAAFLSQIIETTRESAETAGTALKTVIARFQELKKDPSEIGTVDGEIVDANQIETALRSVGVALRDSSGQFRELDDVFLELSSKWGGLDKNTQRYIATIAAGSRQQSRFIAMMSDYGRTQELVTAANNSAGASNRQFEKTLESLDAKMEQLKNAWHEFTMGILDSDLVKFGVDMLTKFLEVLNKITSGLDGLGGSFVKIMGVLGVFKMGMKIFDKFKPHIFNFFSEIVKQAGMSGEKSGQAFSDGVKKSKESSKTPQAQEKPTNYTFDKKGRAHDESGKFVSAEKVYDATFEQRLQSKTTESAYGTDSFKGKVATAGMKVTGGDKFQDAWNAHKLAKEQDGILGSNRKERKQKQQQYSSNKKELDTLKQKKKPNKEETNRIKTLEKETKDYEKAQDRFAKASEKQWSSISEGISSASSALLGVSVGLGLASSALESAGLDGAAEAFNKMSQYAATASAVLGIIPPILSVIQMLFPGVGAASAAAGGTAAAAGTAASTAWSIVGIIVLAVVAAIVVALAVVLLIMAAVNNASPEKKLEKTRASADAAAKAADAAAESYDNLANSLDSLGDKYKSLEELTKGTKEWNEAVQSINSSVLDLIDEYPELASLVKNEGGVLKLDIESDEVQSVLNDAYASKITTKNASIMANAAVADAENDVKYDNLKNTHFFDSIESLGNYEKYKQGQTVEYVGGQEIGEQIAKAIVNGDVGTTQEGMAKYLKDEMGLQEKDADLYADLLWENEDELREFGESLKAAEAQQQAAYNAVASSAMSLANTLTMSEEEINQASTMVDGDMAERIYDEELADLKEDLSGVSDKDLKDNDKVKEALQQQYGPGATMDKSGKVYNKAGEQVDTLTRDELLGIMATQNATKKAARAIELAPQAIKAMGEATGASAINALYASDNGGSLTQDDLTTLKETLGNLSFTKWNEMSDEQKKTYKTETGFSKGIKDQWDALTPDMKEVLYGNDITKMIDQMAEAVESADDAFIKAADRVKGFMTADMAKGFQQKLDEVAEKAGGAASVAAIDTKTDELLSGKNNDQKRSIQARIDATDWSSIESLLALQIDLEQQYGYMEGQAKAYTQALGDASFATSRLTTTVKTFGALWEATEKLNQSMQRLEDLQWEYNRAIEKGADNISELTQQMVSEISGQAQLHETAYNESNEDISRIYAQGALNYGVDLTDFVKLGKNGVDVDNSRLQEAIDSGKVSEDDANAWIEKLNEQYAISREHLQGMKDSLEQIEELEQQGKDAYYELRDMAKEAILDSLQKQIDLEQQTLDATKNANSQLINKIQEQIDDNRQARAIDEAKQNIADLQSQAAYLGMDTSGANDLALMGVNEQIEQAEQSYQDTLVDQTLQELQDANARAEEQRERQISLAQQQLDAYSLSKEFQMDVDYQLQELLDAESNWQNTGLGEKLKETFTNGMSAEELVNWGEAISGKIGLADVWQNTNWATAKEGIETKIESITSAINNLSSLLEVDAKNKANQARATNLSSKGFDLSDLGVSQDSSGTYTGITEKHEQAFKNMESFSGRNNAEENTKLASELTAKGQDYLDEQRFYDLFTTSFKNSDTITVGAQAGGISHGQDMRVTSYTDYLRQLNNNTPEKSEESQNLNYGVLDPTQAHASEYFWNGKADKTSNKGFSATLDGTSYWLEFELDYPLTDSEKIEALNNYKAENGIAAPYVLGYYGDKLYYGANGNWYSVYKDTSDYVRDGIAANGKTVYDKIKAKFETGGLADFTGPAWLDGTKSKPEYVLNANQTERFFSLVDVLERFDNKEAKQSGGDNYFEIEINVEKLENDYDVEKVADKIRRMIYEDASYRNVNTINLIR